MYPGSDLPDPITMAQITPIDSAAEAREQKRRNHETALLVQVRDHGDRDAFEHLFALFAPRVTNYVPSLGVDAEGPDAVAQDVMLAVWTKARLFDADKASARTWIYTLARNRYIDLKRSQQREPNAFQRLQHDSPSAIDKGDRAANYVDAAAVAELLKDVPPEQAEVIVLAFVEGYSHREIAERLGVSIGTTKSRIRLAFKKLRERMGVTI